MTWFKRIFLFSLVNILIIVMVSLVMNLFGIRPYMTAYGINYESLMIFCLLWGMGGSFISLMMSKTMAKMFMRVKIVDGDAQYAQLVQTVHSLARRAKIDKMPEVGVYQSPELNAFATGPSKNNSLVAVSTGLLQRMNQEELEGVLGHEVAHISNGDMVTLTLIQGVVNAFVMFFARIAAFALSQAMRGDDDDGPAISGGFAHFAMIMVFEVLFGLLGSMVVAFFSRFREFRADEGGARLAGKHKMIAALEALKNGVGHNDDSQKAFSSMKISSDSKILAMLSTHPPLEERIKTLYKLPIA